MAKNGIKVLLIGGSAGSLDAILQILPQLRKDLAMAIVIIIHRKSSFASSLVDLLASRTVLKVKEAEEKEHLEPGIIYIAPADYHLLIEDNFSFSLDFSEKILHSRPAINATFQTAAEVFGDSAAAILLSGANADGADGVVAIQKAGGLTIVQDPTDAEINYMPTQALAIMEPDYIIKKWKMAELINSLQERKSH